MNSSEIMDLLKWTGAIMKGHFKLTSGRHSDTYIEKFRLLENPIALDKICLTMSEKFSDQKIDMLPRLIDLSILKNHIIFFESQYIHAL